MSTRGAVTLIGVGVAKIDTPKASATAPEERLRCVDASSTPSPPTAVIPARSAFVNVMGTTLLNTSGAELVVSV